MVQRSTIILRNLCLGLCCWVGIGPGEIDRISQCDAFVGRVVNLGNETMRSAVEWQRDRTMLKCFVPDGVFFGV
jgi:hypothetical protein